MSDNPQKHIYIFYSTQEQHIFDLVRVRQRAMRMLCAKGSTCTACEAVKPDQLPLWIIMVVLKVVFELQS